MGERGEQRRSERHRVRLRVVYDDGGSFNAGLARDVSEGGLFVETALPARIGTTITVTPASASTLEIRARVVRVIAYDPQVSWNLTAGMGLELVDLNADQRREVVQLLRQPA
jgi:hypothetical protein